VCIAPANAPDPLAEGVVAALTRSFNPRLYWGPIKTVVLGLLTGGLLPLIVLPKRFRDAVIGERTHLWHFTEWIRLQQPCPDTEKLHRTVSSLRFRWSLWILSLALAGLAVAWAWRDLAALGQRTVISYGPFGAIMVTPLIEPFTPKFLFNFTARLPHEGFALLMIAAYILSLWQVVAHFGDVRQVVELYNALTLKRPDLGFKPVRAPAAAAALRFDAAWIACIVGLLVLGAYWGVPMVLAAAAQSRYIKTTGRRVRLAFAGQAFNVLADRRPMLHLPLPEALCGKCAREKCEAPIGVGAQFCSRCGERVKASV
jgi:hypothetical protein